MPVVAGRLVDISALRISSTEVKLRSKRRGYQKLPSYTRFAIMQLFSLEENFQRENHTIS